MSMSDWNDKQNGANMVLSTAQKYEGSKSLRIHGIANDELIKILDASEIDNPPSVNFDFYSYFNPISSYVAVMAVFFRYQDTENFYALAFEHTYGGSPTLYSSFKKRVASNYTLAGDHNYMGNLKEQWLHFKVLFCEIANTVYCLLYREENSEWVLKMERTLSKEWSNGALGVGALPPIGVMHANSHVYLDNLTVYYT